MENKKNNLPQRKNVIGQPAKNPNFKSTPAAGRAATPNPKPAKKSSW